jgi:lysophospholipase L1-like esterase
VGFEAYVALGDSMSIDRYPDLDHVARRDRAGTVSGLGAASLFARNHDAVWPEFAGRDLAARHPAIACRFLASDGATTRTVLDVQIEQLRTVPRSSDAVVTLTVGGNDLLSLVGARDAEGRAGVRATLGNLEAILDGVGRHVPRALLLVANVYDPTDASGRLEGTRLRREEMQWLADFNDGVARLCVEDGALLVDLHRHFAGHGVAAPPAERWYWTGSLIEPGYRGASEIRRLWLDALEDTAIR